MTTLRNKFTGATAKFRSAIRQVRANCSAFKMPSVRDMLKLVAVASVAIYGELFLCYREYYRLLGIKPEDVGVDNAFVLVRSFAFIVWLLTAMALILFIAALFTYVRVILRGNKTWSIAETLGFTILIGALVVRSCLGVSMSEHGCFQELEPANTRESGATIAA